MKIFWKISAAGLAALFALSLSACGSSKEMNPADALAVMQTDIPFSEELTGLDKAAICKNYDLEETDLAGCAAAIGSGATAENAAVLEGVDSAAAGRIQTALRAFLDDWIEGYSDYKPEEVPKLEQAVLKVKGNYVILCISADSGKAAAVVKDILG